MKTKTLLVILSASVGGFLSGCLNLTPPATAEQSHGLTLTSESSARVQVNGPRLQMNHGNLELAGSISKKPGASTAAFSHLDILFCDGSGGVVVTRPISFFPRMVGESRFSSQLGYYALKLEPCRKAWLGSKCGRTIRTSLRPTAKTAKNVRNAHPQPEIHLKSRIPIIIGAVFALLGLFGCVTPFRAPADLAHINLERAYSPVVMIEKVWLERKMGELFLTGSAIKRLGAIDTTQTHLDVTLFDASGRVLRSSIEHFDPRQIPYGHRIHGHSQYRVALGPLPPDTARIEVRAHEGDAASPHG